MDNENLNELFPEDETKEEFTDETEEVVDYGGTFHERDSHDINDIV